VKEMVEEEEGNGEKETTESKKECEDTSITILICMSGCSKVI
jgi:hypothetical protein